jgi:hypothetical protein
MAIPVRFEDYPRKIIAMGQTVRYPHVKTCFGGQPGGKWRGTGFYYDLLKENEPALAREFGGKVLFAIPKTTILQTDCFFDFVEQNRLSSLLGGRPEDGEVVAKFLSASFSDGQKAIFQKLLEHHTRPMVARSSSLVEDSERTSFAGIFNTVFLPNQHTDDAVRLLQFEYAVKLVYASALSLSARDYRERMGINADDQMAIMVQNVVGRHWNDTDGASLYYPEGAYAAFTYNDYAAIGAAPRDGFARVSFGLGPGAVGNAERTFLRVNLGKPYPLAGMYDLKQTLGGAPKYFYALAFPDGALLPDNEDFFLRKLEIHQHGEKTLVNPHLEYYDYQDDRISVGPPGAPLFLMPEFFNEYRGLFTPAIRFLNSMLRSKFGMEVDHEGAFDSIGDSLVIYPLQARPQVRSEKNRVEALPEIPIERQMLRAKNALGKGKYSIKKAVFVPLEAFDFRAAHEIGAELREINQELRELGADGQYALIVPGRLGSEDASLGIPAKFFTISHAAAIIERIVGDKGWEASQGTHMFEGVVGAGMALCSYDNEGDLREKLAMHSSGMSERKFAKVYTFEKPFETRIDKEGNLLMFAAE